MLSVTTLILSKDGKVAPRAVLKGEQLYVCGGDFVSAAGKSIPPGEAAHKICLKAMSANMVDEVPTCDYEAMMRTETAILDNHTHKFNGSEELCLNVEVLKMVYKYMDKNGIVNEKYRKDILAGLRNPKIGSCVEIPGPPPVVSSLPPVSKVSELTLKKLMQKNDDAE